MMAGTFCYRLEVVGKPEVVVVDSMEDLHSVREVYSNDNQLSGYLNHGLNFCSMASDYAGMRLTKEGQVATRMTPLDEPDLYGWDSESTIWFEWCFEVAEFLGEYESSENY
jgi:hypothetical protein